MSNPKKSDLKYTDLTGSWGQVASHLLEVEKTKSWGQTHSSLSSWVMAVARQFDKSDATLWRALAAGRYYNELRSELKSEGLDFPPLDSTAVAASPESLELTDKLSRIAPADLVKRVQRDVMAGNISRRELRTYWETYRPVLQGMTARGRNVVAPRFNPKDIAMIGSRLEADCIAGLIKSGSRWLGHERAEIYKVIRTVQPGEISIRPYEAPDVIVAFQPDRRSPLEIHGVEATVRPESNSLLRTYFRRGLGVDFLWVAVPTEVRAELRRSIPEEVGLLQADPGGVRIIRKAAAAKHNVSELAATLRAILAREIVA